MFMQIAPNFELHHHAILGSTNDEAARLLQLGEGHHRLVITADKQTKGRGRQGRAWVSDKGNLFASLIVKPEEQEEQNWPQLGFVMSLSIAETLQHILPLHQVQVKWPNDVLVDGKKICGLLLERVGDYMIIGFGVNCYSHPAETLFPAASLNALGVELGAQEILARILHAFDRHYIIWNGTGFASIRTAWLKMAFKLGETIQVKQGDAPLTGVFTDINANDGRLILKKPDGELVLISAGDVYS
jgi:BirA family biotin operon repressor/biotin-[acetyl-CoA-carboxylase] ligase